MQGFSLLLVLVASVQWSNGYITYDRNDANKPDTSSRTAYTYHSSSTLSSTSTSSAYVYGSCCDLDKFGLDHLKEITEFANRLKHEYNSVSDPKYSISSYQPWSKSISTLTGKSAEELDEICRRQSEKLVKDLNNGLFANNDVDKINFFEWIAGNVLGKNFAPGLNDQHQTDGFSYTHFNPAENHYDSININHNDQQQTNEFPDFDFKPAANHYDSVNSNHNDQQQTNEFPDFDFKPAANHYDSVNSNHNDQQQTTESPVFDFNHATNHYDSVNSNHNDQQQTDDISYTHFNPAGNHYDSVNSNHNDQQQTTESPVFDFNHATNHYDSVNSNHNDQQQITEFPDIHFNPAGNHYDSVNSNHNDQQQTTESPVFDFNHATNHYDSVNSNHNDQQQITEFPDIHFNPAGNHYDSVNSNYNDQQQITEFPDIHFNPAGNHNRPYLNKPKESNIAETNTVTVSRYNRTIVSTPDGTVTTGSEQHKKWIDGKLVYDVDRPLGKWQEEELKSIKQLIENNDLIYEELETFIANNKKRLQDLSLKYKVPENDVQHWLQREINSLQKPRKTEDWQAQWRASVANMLKERDFTIEEFDKWASEETNRLKNLYKRPNIKTGDLDRLIANEKHNLIVFDVLKPTEKLTNWQQDVQNILQNIVQEPCQTIDELEERLKENSEPLNKITTEYHITPYQIELFINAYLSKLFNEGKLKINTLTAWQIPARQLLDNILQRNPDCSLDELQNILTSNKDYIQKIGFEYHVSAKEFEEYMQKELHHLQQEGKLNTEIITQWKKQLESTLKLLKLQQNISLENMEKETLIRQYNKEVDEKKRQVKEILTNFEQNTLYTDLNQWQSNKAKELANTQHLINSKIQDWQNQQDVTVSKLQDARNQKQHNVRDTVLEQNKRIVKLMDDHKKFVNDVITDATNKLKSLLNKDFLNVLGEKLNKALTHEGEYHHDFEFKKNILQINFNQLSAKYDSEVSELKKRINSALQNFHYQHLFKPEEVVNFLNTQNANLNEIIQLNLSKFNDNLNKLLSQYVERVNYAIKEINDKAADINKWIVEETKHLQDTGISQIKKELDNWQQVERNRQLTLSRLHKLSVKELKEQIENDRRHLHQSKTRFEEIQTSMRSQKSKLDHESLLKFKELEQLKEQLLKIFELILETTNSNGESLIHDEEINLTRFLNDFTTKIQQFENFKESDEERVLSLNRNVINTITRLNETYEPELETSNINLINTLRDLLGNERSRLQEIFKSSYDFVINIDKQIADDRTHLENLAKQYNISLEELQKWHKQELLRLKKEAQLQATLEKIKDMIHHYGYTKEQFYQNIVNDPKIISHLANIHKMPVDKFLKWLQEEINVLNNQGFFDNVHNELADWQIKEKEYLQNIIHKHHQPTFVDLELNINIDLVHLMQVAAKNAVKESDVKEWLLKELDYSQFLGTVRPTKLNPWQKHIIDDIISSLESNSKLSIDDLKDYLLGGQHLFNLAKKYNVSTTEIKNFVINICQRLQGLGQFNNWQTVVHQYIIDLIVKYNPSPKELKDKINKDYNYLYGLSKQYNVNIGIVLGFIHNVIDKLEAQHFIEPKTLSDWQTKWRINVINMLKERDFNVDDFSKWVSQYLSNANHADDENINSWINQEVQRYIVFGLLKPNEKLTGWQLAVRQYLSDVLQQPCQSFEELQQRLSGCPQLFEKLAQEYHIETAVIESWMKKDLARFLIEGKLQINNLNAWQISLEKYLVALLKQKPTWTLQELNELLNRSEDYFKKIAFRYHQSPEDVKQWIIHFVNDHFQHPHKPNIDNITQWIKEQQRVFDLFEQLFKTIVESRAEEEHRNRLEQLIKEHNDDVAHVYGDLEIYKTHLMQDELFEELKQYQEKDIERLHKIYPQLEKLLEHIPLEQLSSQIDTQLQKFIELIERDKEILKKRTTPGQDQKQIDDAIKGTTQTDFDIESRNDLNEWQNQQSHLLSNVHDKQAAANDLKVKVNFLENHLTKLAQKYKFEANELKELLDLQLSDLNSKEKTTFDNLKEWEKSEESKLKELIETFENTKNEIHHNQHIDKENLDKLYRDMEQMATEIHSWLESKAIELRHKYDAKLQYELDILKHIRYDLIISATTQHYISIKELEYKIQKDKNLLQQKKVFIENYKTLISAEIQSVTNEGLAKLKDFDKKQSDAIQQWSSVAQQHNSEAQSWLNQIPEYISQFAKQHGVSFKNFVESFDVLLRNLRKLYSEYINGHADLNRKFKDEVYRLKNQVNGITELLNTERDRLTNIFKSPHSSVISSVDMLAAKDFLHLQNLANRHNINVKTLIEWEKEQIKRLQKDAQSQKAIDDLKKLINKFHLTFDECQNQIINNPSKLQDFAIVLNMNVTDVKEWLRAKINDLATEGFFNGPREVLPDWRLSERDRLQFIVERTNISPQDCELLKKIELSQLAAKKPDRVKELEQALKDELLRLQILGKIKPHEDDDLKNYVNHEIILLLQNNKLNIDDLESKLLNNPALLTVLPTKYNVQITKLESVIKNQCNLLRALDLPEIHIDSVNSYVEKLPLFMALREHLQNWLSKQNSIVTPQYFDNFVKHEKPTWQHFAEDYNVDLSRIYSWLDTERSKLLALDLQDQDPSNNIALGNTFNIKNGNTFFPKIGQQWTDKGLIINKATEEGVISSEMSRLQKLIREKLQSHQTLSIDEVRNTLRAGGHYRQPQIQIENFDEQNHQSYDYYSHTKAPVPNNNLIPYKVNEYFLPQQLPADQNFGQSQAYDDTNQPRWSVKSYAQSDIPALEIQTQAHDLSKVFGKSSNYYKQ